MPRPTLLPQVRPEEPPGPLRILAELGEWVSEAGRTLVGLVGFFGSVLIAFAAIIRWPKRFRLNAVIQRFDLVGVRALGIIGLMSFLIGIVIGQQARSSSSNSVPRFTPSTW